MSTEITCKLTGTRGKPVKAHIIPRSFYDFDKADHKPARVIHLAGDDSRMSKAPVGEYDTSIVTTEGEAYFSEGDGYACDWLVRRGQENATLYHDGQTPQCIEVPDVDYRKLKLFFLGLLWRVGVSSRPLFRRVSLGPHEARVRELILNRDPGFPNDYAVVLGIHRDTPEYGLPMLEPEPMRDDETKIRYYKFYLGHLIACIKVDSQPYGDSWEEFVLRPDKPLRFVMLDDFKKASLYRRIQAGTRRLYDQRR